MIRKRVVEKQEGPGQRRSRGFRDDTERSKQQNAGDDIAVCINALDSLFPTSDLDEDNVSACEEEPQNEDEDLAYEALDAFPTDEPASRRDTLARWLASKPSSEDGSVLSPRQNHHADEVQSVATTASSYLEDLEAQMRENKARKMRQKQADTTLEAKVAGGTHCEPPAELK